MSAQLANPLPAAAVQGELITAESLGRQLRASLPPMRLHSVSLYNAEGDVLWLSEGALGPDEHGVVLDAMQTLQAQASMNYHESGLEDGRFGIFLPVRAPRGNLVGLVMILTDLKSVPDGIAERLAIPKVRTILQRIAVYLRVGSTRAGETMPIPVLPPATAEAPTLATPLSPSAIDQLITLELVEDVPAASPAEVAPDLMLYVQELIKLRSSGRTRRYEVLARSRRDASRNAVPAAFVAESAAGQDGAALDGLVVQQLVAWLGNHREIYDGEPASFSINLSIGALSDERFLDSVAAALKTAGIPPESLGFEIRESACVQCRTEVQRFVAACEPLGCFVVLDDFTFDSAAVPLLASKALRMVKIDAKLTTAALRDKLPQALVIAIAQACKVLGLHCIAKRVDHETTLDWLDTAGCDLAQGFALERPLSLETLASPPPARPRPVRRK